MGDTIPPLQTDKEQTAGLSDIIFVERIHRRYRFLKTGQYSLEKKQKMAKMG
jgi:hypothetical protein